MSESPEVFRMFQCRTLLRMVGEASRIRLFPKSRVRLEDPGIAAGGLLRPAVTLLPDGPEPVQMGRQVRRIDLTGFDCVEQRL